MSSFFETIMLVCFGLSWPINVIKAYKARTAKATSLPFIILIFTGYISGITAPDSFQIYKDIDKWYISKTKKE